MEFGQSGRIFILNIGDSQVNRICGVVLDIQVIRKEGPKEENLELH